MIICPNCKEEIDDDSHFCDQCGQFLLYCGSCGRVGIGRRCVHCGGLMLTPADYEKHVAAQTSLDFSMTGLTISRSSFSEEMGTKTDKPKPSQAIPELTLYNTNLNIRIHAINGAIIGRRQGPYTEYFSQNRYVSGAHAQLKYNGATGWCIVDKHSSNGTLLNQHPVQPDVEMSLKNGDIVSFANVNLEVRIN